MNENIKNIISSKIKYHSNKQKYGYFMGNDCIDICASDILEDVIKAGYRKQADVAREFAEKACNRMDNYGVPLAIKQIQGEIRSVAQEYGVEEK